MYLLGSHVGMSGKDMMLGSVKTALSYGANTFMLYTGAPQNTRRKKIEELNIPAARELMKENGIETFVVHAPYIINLANTVKPETFQIATDFLAVELERTEAMGSETLVLHPGSHVGAGEEAGIEQINRRVLEKVTHLLLVSDQSRKGIQVVGTIKQVADELVMYDRIGAVINRVTNPDLNKFITIPGVEILSYIESDDYHAANDIQGKTVYDLPPESSVYRGTKEVLDKFGIL